VYSARKIKRFTDVLPQGPRQLLFGSRSAAGAGQRELFEARMRQLTEAAALQLGTRLDSNGK
jgi:hypothetical protein